MAIQFTSQLSGSSLSTGSFSELHLSDKLGIGTTSPAMDLDVVAQDAKIKIMSERHNAGTSTTNHFTTLGYDSSGARPFIINNQSNTPILLKNNAGSIPFAIHTNQYVGINTTSPTIGRLQVNPGSESTVGLAVWGANDGIKIQRSNGGNTGAYAHIFFTNSDWLHMKMNGGDTNGIGVDKIGGVNSGINPANNYIQFDGYNKKFYGYNQGSRVYETHDHNGILIHLVSNDTFNVSGSLIQFTPTEKVNVTGNIEASGNISGSSTSTGSFGKLLGDGAQITGLPGGFSVANSANNRILTSVDSTNGNAESALTFNGTTLVQSVSSGTVKLDFSGGGGAGGYNYFIRASNDGGVKAVHFVNGSSRTADNAANSYTIRNDGGGLHLGSSSQTTIVEGSAITFKTATSISGSSASTGSFGALSVGGGSGLNYSIIENKLGVGVSSGIQGQIATFAINSAGSDGLVEIRNSNNSGDASLRFHKSGGVHQYTMGIDNLGVFNLTHQHNTRGGKILSVNGASALIIHNDLSGSSTSTGSFSDGRFANKVGIGTNAPVSTLHVEGVSTATSGDAAAGITLKAGGEKILQGWNEGNVNIGNGTFTTAYKIMLHGATKVQNAHFVLDQNKKMSWGNQTVYLAGSEANGVDVYHSNTFVTRTNSTGIGIKTTDISYPLDVHGNMMLSGDLYGFQDGSGRVYDRKFISFSPQPCYYTGDNNHFHTFKSYGNTAIMSIGGSSNRVGIGTTSPGQTLHVAGGALVTGTLLVGTTVQSYNGDLYLKSNNSETQIFLDNDDIITFKTSNSERLRITDSEVNIPGNAVIGGTLTAQEFRTEFNTTTVIATSGSTKFGNTADDKHQFTGSIETSGSISIYDQSPTINFFDTNTSNLKHRIIGGGNIGLEYSADINNTGAGYHRWDCGNAERMRLIENGNLGIGTVSPSVKLHLDSSSTTELRIQDGTNKVLRIRQQNNGAFLTAETNNSLTFTTNGNNTAMHMDTSQRVAVGTTSIPATHTDQAHLSIGADASIIGSKTSGTSTNSTFAHNAYFDVTNSRWEYIGASSNQASALQLLDGKIVSKVAVAGTANNAITWIDAMAITSAGNVGIATSSPSALLHINAEDTNNNTYIPNIRLERAITANTNPVGGFSNGIDFYHSKNNNATQKYMGSIRMDQESGGFPALGGDMQFYVATGSTADDPSKVLVITGGDGKRRLGLDGLLQVNESSFNPGTNHHYITGGSNFGIGTTSPSQRLHVHTSANTSARFSTGNVLNYIHITNSGGANHYIQTNQHSVALSADANNTRGSVQLMTSNTTRLQVTSGGNIGIGTGSPNNPLDVRRTSDGIALELQSTVGDANEFVDFKMISGNSTAGTLGTIFRHQRQGAGGGDMIIFTNPGLTATPLETIRLTSDQKVGIGGDPDQKLDVSAGHILIDNGYYILGRNNGGSQKRLLGFDGATCRINDEDGNTIIGAASTTVSIGGNIVAGGNITTAGQILSPGGANIALNPNTGLVTVGGNIQASGTGTNSIAGNLLFSKANGLISGSATSTGSFGSLVVANNLTAGTLTGTVKSFLIDHPTKEGKKLQYGSLEGPEHGVYVRGKTKTNVIELPDYWTGLVDEDTLTVNLTPIGKFQHLFVKEIKDNKVFIECFGSSEINCFYTVNAERKDVDKLEIEFDVS